MFRTRFQGPGSLRVSCFPVFSLIFLLTFSATQGLAEANFDLSLITEKTRRYTYVDSFHSEKFAQSSSVACAKEVVFDPKDVVKVDESTLTYGAGAISTSSAGDPCSQAKRLTLMKYTGGSSSLPDSDVQIYSSHLTPDSLGRVSAMFASPATLLLTCPVILASDVVYARNGREAGLTSTLLNGPVSFIVSPSTVKIANGLILKANTLHLFMSCPECTACTPAVVPTDCSCLYEGGSVASSPSPAVEGSVAPSSSAGGGSVAPSSSSARGGSVAPSSSAAVGGSGEPSTPSEVNVTSGTSMWVWLGPVLGAVATVVGGSFVFCVRSRGRASQLEIP